MIKNTGKFCGNCKNNMDHYLINGKWICFGCSTYWNYLERRRIFCANDEQKILDDAHYLRTK